MLAMTRTACVVIVLCSIVLLTCNSAIPSADNNPIVRPFHGPPCSKSYSSIQWSGTGATHTIHTPVKYGNHTMRARMAAFGANRFLGDEEVYATDLEMTARLGCSAADVGVPRQQGNWILLQRGDCAFIQKVRTAQRAGFHGVVVGDDGTSYEALITMFARAAGDITIPSLFVTHESYAIMHAAAAAAAAAATLPITIESSALRTDWPLLDTLLFICFSPLCTLATVYLVLYCRRRKLHRNNILPPAYLAKLECIAYLAKDGVNAECVICLESFTAEESLLELPCLHLYHAECIRKWLIERKKICPICKRDVCVGIDVRDGRVDEADIASEETPLLRSTATQTQTQDLGPSESL